MIIYYKICGKLKNDKRWVTHEDHLWKHLTKSISTEKVGKRPTLDIKYYQFFTIIIISLTSQF